MKLVKDLFKNTKKPWEVTGIASTADYLEYLPTGTEYRKISPGSQPVKAQVVHDVPQLVYNTRYYVRDYRRHNSYTARTVDHSPLDVDKIIAALPLKPEDISYAPLPESVKDRGF